MNFSKKLIPAKPPTVPVPIAQNDEKATSSTHFIPRRRPQETSTKGGGRRATKTRPHSIGATIISNPKLVKEWEYHDNSPNQRDMSRHFSALQLGQGGEGTTALTELKTFLASYHEEDSASSEEEDKTSEKGSHGGESARSEFGYCPGGGGGGGDALPLEGIGKDVRVGMEVKAQVAPKKRDSCFEATSRRLSPIVGILLTLIATTCLSLAAALLTPNTRLIIYWTPSEYHPYTLLAWTSQGLFWASFIVLLCPCQMRSVSLTNRLHPPSLVNSRGGTIFLLFLRAIFGWTAALLNLWARNHISPNTATFFAWLSPLPALLLGRILFREKIGWVPFLAAILVSTGTGCLVPPQLPWDNSLLLGTSLSVGALVTEGVLAPLILRHLRHVHFALVTFTYGLTGVAGGIYLYYVHRDLWSLPKCSGDTIQAGILCVLVFLGHTGLTAALKSEMVGIFAVTRCWFLPMMYVWGIWYMEKPFHWLSSLGALLILLAVVMLVARKLVQSRPRTSRVQKICGFLML